MLESSLGTIPRGRSRKTIATFVLPLVTKKLAQEYAAEALQWLIDDGIVTSVEVTTAWFDDDFLAIYIVISQGSNQLYQDTFEIELRAA